MVERIRRAIKSVFGEAAGEALWAAIERYWWLLLGPLVTAGLALWGVARTEFAASPVQFTLAAVAFAASIALFFAAVVSLRRIGERASVAAAVVPPSPGVLPGATPLALVDHFEAITSDFENAHVAVIACGVPRDQAGAEKIAAHVEEMRQAFLRLDQDLRTYASRIDKATDGQLRNAHSAMTLAVLMVQARVKTLLNAAQEEPATVKEALEHIRTSLSSHYKICHGLTPRFRALRDIYAKARNQGGGD